MWAGLSRVSHIENKQIKKQDSSTWYTSHTYFAHNTELWPLVQTAIIKFRSRQIFFLRVQFQFRVSFFSSSSRFIIFFWFSLCYVCNVQQWARYENAEREAPNGDENRESRLSYNRYQQNHHWIKRRTRGTGKKTQKKFWTLSTVD